MYQCTLHSNPKRQTLDMQLLIMIDHIGILWHNSAMIFAISSGILHDISMHIFVIFICIWNGGTFGQNGIWHRTRALPFGIEVALGLQVLAGDLINLFYLNWPNLDLTDICHQVSAARDLITLVLSNLAKPWPIKLRFVTNYWREIQTILFHLNWPNLDLTDIWHWICNLATSRNYYWLDSRYCLEERADLPLHPLQSFFLSDSKMILDSFELHDIKLESFLCPPCLERVHLSTRGQELWWCCRGRSQNQESGSPGICWWSPSKEQLLKTQDLNIFIFSTFISEKNIYRKYVAIWNGFKLLK